MGDIWEYGSECEQPVHPVIVEPFLIGKYPSTQGQWEMVIGYNPSEHNASVLPMVDVNWYDCQEFIRRLSLLSGRTFRLPSEAEWEYAARSGGKRHKWSGTDSELYLDNYAWHFKNAEYEVYPVGLKQPNDLGIHDMSGNVWEWCQDRWHDNYCGAPSTGVAWEDTDESGDERVVRGGSTTMQVFVRMGRIVSDIGNNVRTASRGRYSADLRFRDSGFRLVFQLDEHSS